MDVSDLYSRPAFNLVSLASIPLKDTAKGVQSKVLDGGTKDWSPDLQAFAFYYLNHCVALIGQQYPNGNTPPELGEIVDLYHGMATRFGTSMFAYLLIICNREARYLREGKDEIGKKYGTTPATSKLIDVIGSSSSAAWDIIKHKATACTLGSYCELMEVVYYDGKWGNMYGGKKWGDIAKVLKSYVLGQIPLVTLLDQSFSLQHNTSAIFNKGVVYHKETTFLKLLLDLQHAGQIPSVAECLLFDDQDFCRLKTIAHHVELLSEFKKVHIKMKTEFPDFGGPINIKALEGSNPKCGTDTLARLKKEVYSAYGIYDDVEEVKASTGATVQIPPKEIYQIGNEKYQIVKRVIK